MITWLLNNSLTLIFLTVLTILAYTEFRKFMERKGMDRTQVLSFLRRKANEVGSHIVSRLAAATVITVVVSVVSFRKFWIPDVFHVVFLTSLMLNYVEKTFKKIAE